VSKIRVGIVILVDALLIIALIGMYYIDQLVNGKLYYYGLIASSGWQQQFYLLFRLIIIFIIVAIFIISLIEMPISAFKDEET
jgi:hypothetical protein